MRALCYPLRLVRNGCLRCSLLLGGLCLLSYLLTTTLLMLTTTDHRSTIDIAHNNWSATTSRTDDFVPAYPDAADEGASNDTDASNRTASFSQEGLISARSKQNPPRWLKVDDRPAGGDQYNSSNLLPLCPDPPPGLIGPMKQAVLLIPGLKEADVIRNHPSVLPGGNWKPTECTPRHKVAVILPFRDRQSHLNRLLDYLIPMLQRQMLDFRFIVTEQYGHDLFNKGRIMNAAFTLAESMGVGCVVFHDVDMFPQDDRNSYGCPKAPRHLGAFVNSLGYELWYDYLVGGVLVMGMDHYRQVNGYSNMYWAWGGEDDDMGKRIQANKFVIERPPKQYGRFTMLKHIKRVRTAPKAIYKLLDTATDRWETDGVKSNRWKIIKITKRPLYYHIYVDVGSPPEEWRQKT